MILSEDNIKNFSVVRTFNDNSERINSLSFSNDGNCLVTGAEDCINVYDCEEGVLKNTIYSQKYGVAHIQFTHAFNTVIYASNKHNDDIRYLSLHDSKFIRFLHGHTKRVVSLCISPADDKILSGSLDGSIRLWDLRSPSCIAMLNVPGKPIGAFDPEGLIFAVGIRSEEIKLFDIRSYERGPFLTFLMPLERTCDWTKLQFSPDNKYILLSTNGQVIRLLDSFEGTPLATLSGFINNKGLPLDASFTPDSSCVISGSTDGRINVWSVKSGSRVCLLEDTDPIEVVHCVGFNPVYSLLAASGNSKLNFWLPKMEEG